MRSFSDSIISPVSNSFWGKIVTFQLIRGHRWKQRPQSIIIVPYRWRLSWSVIGNGNKTKSFTTKIPSEKLLQCLALWILSKRNDFSCCRLLAVTPAKFYIEASRTACWNFNGGWLRGKKRVVPYSLHLSCIMTFREFNI